MVEPSDEGQKQISLEQHQEGRTDQRQFYFPSDEDLPAQTILKESKHFDSPSNLKSSTPDFFNEDTEELLYKSEAGTSQASSEYQNRKVFPSTSTEYPDSDSSTSEVYRAYDKSIEEKSILPILKEELKLKIQTRRLREGQEELVPEDEEHKSYELSEAEREKYQRRLVQNREALRKLKRKEVQREQELKELFDTETARQTKLRREKEELLMKKDNLLQRLNQAGLMCNLETSTVSCTKCGKTFQIDPS